MSDDNETTGQATTHFAVIPEWVLFTASPTAVKIYAILDRHSNRSDECFPGRERLSEMSGCSIATVKRAIAELCDMGALERWSRGRKGGGRTSNGYRILRDQPESNGVKSDPLDEGKRLTSEPFKRVTSDPGKNQSQSEPEGVLRFAPDPQAADGSKTSMFGDPVIDVYGYWRIKRDKLRRNYDTISVGRHKKIAARLKDGFSVDDLKRAIDGVCLDVQRWPDRAQHDDLTVIFRNREQVDRFLDLAAEKEQKRAKAAVCADCGVGGGYHTEDCPTKAGI